MAGDGDDNLNSWFFCGFRSEMDRTTECLTNCLKKILLDKTITMILLRANVWIFCVFDTTFSTKFAPKKKETDPCRDTCVGKRATTTAHDATLACRHGGFVKITDKLFQLFFFYFFFEQLGQLSFSSGFQKWPHFFHQSLGVASLENKELWAKQCHSETIGVFSIAMKICVIPVKQPILGIHQDLSQAMLVISLQPPKMSAATTVQKQQCGCDCCVWSILTQGGTKQQNSAMGSTEELIFILATPWNWNQWKVLDSIGCAARFDSLRADLVSGFFVEHVEDCSTGQEGQCGIQHVCCCSYKQWHFLGLPFLFVWTLDKAEKWSNQLFFECSFPQVTFHLGKKIAWQNDSLSDCCVSLGEFLDWSQDWQVISLDVSCWSWNSLHGFSGLWTGLFPPRPINHFHKDHKRQCHKKAHEGAWGLQMKPKEWCKRVLKHIDIWFARSWHVVWFHSGNSRCIPGHKHFLGHGPKNDTFLKNIDKKRQMLEQCKTGDNESSKCQLNFCWMLDTIKKHNLLDACSMAAAREVSRTHMKLFVRRYWQFSTHRPPKNFSNPQNHVGNVPWSSIHLPRFLDLDNRIKFVWSKRSHSQMWTSHDRVFSLSVPVHLHPSSCKEGNQQQTARLETIRWCTHSLQLVGLTLSKCNAVRVLSPPHQWSEDEFVPENSKPWQRHPVTISRSITSATCSEVQEADAHPLYLSKGKKGFPAKKALHRKTPKRDGTYCFANEKNPGHEIQVGPPWQKHPAKFGK